MGDWHHRLPQLYVWLYIDQTSAIAHNSESLTVIPLEGGISPEVERSCRKASAA